MLALDEKSVNLDLKELSLCHKLDFLIPISLQPNDIDLRYFKL